jgi:glycosyltransferase involved in cell wall biosynthesis
MTIDVTVIISTHNPHRDRFTRTLTGLYAQTLAASQWELILVDNASNVPVNILDLGPQFASNGTLIREPRVGLTFGRFAGIRRAHGRFLVFVDDDNVVAPDYLSNVLSILQRFPRVGLGGGKSVPEWEGSPPDPWVEEWFGNLALRDLGPRELFAEMTDPPTYPACAPIGAGMIGRREAIEEWLDASVTSGTPTGRRGEAFTSGEDCDIVMFALRAGWQVGYFPELVLTHLIPSTRLTRDYLGRLNHGIAKSWVEVLARHGIAPWPAASRLTVPLRKARAYLSYGAWLGPAEYVRWRGACGQFEGRAVLQSK